MGAARAVNGLASILDAHGARLKLDGRVKVVDAPVHHHVAGAGRRSDRRVPAVDDAFRNK